MTILNVRAATLEPHIAHHKIQRPDGVTIIHHEFVVVRKSADFSQDLSLNQCPAKELQSDNAHRIVTNSGLIRIDFLAVILYPFPTTTVFSSIAPLI